MARVYIGMKFKEVYLANNTTMIPMLPQRRNLLMVREVMDAQIDMTK